MLIHELGLDIDIEAVDVRPPGMGGANSTADFLAINPNGKVCTVAGQRRRVRRWLSARRLAIANSRVENAASPRS